MCGKEGSAVVQCAVMNRGWSPDALYLKPSDRSQASQVKSLANDHDQLHSASDLSYQSAPNDVDPPADPCSVKADSHDLCNQRRAHEGLDVVKYQRALHQLIVDASSVDRQNFSRGAEEGYLRILEFGQLPECSSLHTSFSSSSLFDGASRSSREQIIVERKKQAESVDFDAVVETKKRGGLSPLWHFLDFYGVPFVMLAVFLR